MSPLYIGCIFINLFCLIYIGFKLNKLSIFKKLNNNKYKYLIVILICALIFGLTFIRIAPMTFVIIHFTVIMGLVDIIFYFINKKRENKIWIQTPISFGFTIIYLSISLFLGLKVFETNYSIKTNKMDNHLRIAQITDVHLGSTFDGDTFSSYMKDISKRNVDLLCVTGDFVDDETKRKDMVKACKALGEFKSTYGVYFVFGNHEAGYYPKYRDFDTADLIEELKLNNVTILEDQVIEIGEFYLIGRKDLSNPTRLSIDELIEGLDDKYKIVLNHQPNDYDSEKGKVDLVLSGHTHGGNVFPINFLINMLNDQTYGIKKLNNTNFIVSSGISCWALPFNNVTIQEYVIIDIN